MKRFAMAVCVALCVAGAAGADPIEGVWRTLSDDAGHYGYVRFAPCGARICGTLIKTFAGEGKEAITSLVGRKVIWDMEAKGGGAYGGGKIWSYEEDRVYDSRLRLHGAALEISGCMVFVCQTVGDWIRVQ
ncbi:hypothetical protein GALL_410890 [mine drainage metagenome]|uniref:DUF2147 domain-containing protein n=1 Tax=mine drainage metagenome TaxID=410659 RepID=A0A1J5Q0L4_9ZZZZ